MSDVNNVTLIGRLTADPMLKYLPSGSAVVEFSIANNYYVSTKNANEVNYFDVVAFGKTAETISKYLTKGKQIAINGSLRQDRWQDKDTNTTKSRIRITRWIRKRVNLNKKNKLIILRTSYNFLKEVPFY